MNGEEECIDNEDEETPICILMNMDRDC